MLLLEITTNQYDTAPKVAHAILARRDDRGKDVTALSLAGRRLLARGWCAIPVRDSRLFVGDRNAPFATARLGAVRDNKGVRDNFYNADAGMVAGVVV
ncbi:MAG: hypothetical protein ABIU96_10750 [Rhodanobacter sp.]